MKRCPQCAADYFDDMLEFCLEDGAKLSVVSNSLREREKESKVTAKPFAPHFPTEKTFNLPYVEEAQTVESLKPTAQNHLTAVALEKSLSVGSKILETAPLVIALTHNWWQWLYAVNHPTDSISSFVFSAGFLIWLALLVIGAGLGWLVAKRCQNKGYAYAGLVILSINLILFLVPKR